MKTEKSKFAKLNRKIYRSIMIPSLLLIAAIALLSTLMLRSSMKSTFQDMARQKFSRSADSCGLYLSSVGASAYNISLNAEVIDAVKSAENPPLTELLDNSCHFDEKIAAISVYTLDGRKFNSSTVSAPPSLAELSADEGMNAFFSGDKESFVSVRNTAVPQIYNNTFYPAENGIISCCCKIFDGDRVIGYVVADVLPSSLYAFFDYSDTTYFQKTVTFIGLGKLFTKYSDNAGKESLLKEICEEKPGFDLKYAYFYSQSTLPVDIYCAVPLTGYYNFVIFIGAAFLGVGLLLLTAVHFIGKYQAAKVSARLDGLLRRMEGQGLE